MKMFRYGRVGALMDSASIVEVITDQDVELRRMAKTL